jgi:hypothetical protein
MRHALLITALACTLGLSLQPPAESSLGTTPTPPVVGMTGGTGAETPAMPQDLELTIAKHLIGQGILGIVLLILGWSYRRDFLRKQEATEDAAAKDRAAAAEDRRAFIVLVEKSTASMVNSEQTNARLARAIEAQRLLPPGAGI